MLKNKLYFAPDIPELLLPFLNLNRSMSKGKGLYKPLLVLIMLMRLKYEGARAVSFKEIDDVLTKVMKTLLKGNTKIYTEEPFCRLANDGIWKIDKRMKSITRARWNSIDSRIPSRSKLKKLNPSGQFSKKILDLMDKSPELIDLITERMINQYFDINSRDLVKHLIGYYETDISNILLFRRNVLQAYNSSCSLCGKSDRFYNSLINIKATPVKKDQQENYIHASNGIAFCNLHSIFFNLGVISIKHFSKNKYIVITSENEPTNQVAKFNHIHQKELNLLKNEEYRFNIPLNLDDRPSDQLLNWHYENKFNGIGHNHF